MSNNFTMIPNNVQDASFRVKLNGTQHRILEAVKRRTYGYHEKKAKLSLSYLAEMIGADRNDVDKMLKELEARRILIQEVSHGRSRYIYVNENTEEWVLTVGEKPHRKKRTVGETTHTTVGEDTHRTVGELPHQINKDLNKSFKERSSAAATGNQTEFHESQLYSESDRGGESIADIHTKVFGTIIMSPLMSDFIRRQLNDGHSEEFVKELMLETGESTARPNLRYMESVAVRWIREGIASREQARAQKSGTDPGMVEKQSRSRQSKTQEFLRSSIREDLNDLRERIDITPKMG